MRFAIIDNDHSAVMHVKELMKKSLANCWLFSFSYAKDFLAWPEILQVDVVILDVDIPDMNGFRLIEKLRTINPRVSVIIITETSKYALEAHGFFVSGYLLKPVEETQILEVIEHLRPITSVKVPHIRIQTFGNFDIFVDGEPLSFPRSKAKELLAYLVHNQGSSSTTAEIAAVLWEDKPYSRSLQSQTQKVISVMMQTLRKVDAAGIIIKHTNQIQVDTSRFECDIYDYMKRKTNEFAGDYMQCYSWAESKNGYLSNLMY